MLINSLGRSALHCVPTRVLRVKSNLPFSATFMLPRGLHSRVTHSLT